MQDVQASQEYSRPWIRSMLKVKVGQTGSTTVVKKDEFYQEVVECQTIKVIQWCLVSRAGLALQRLDLQRMGLGHQGLDSGVKQF